MEKQFLKKFPLTIGKYNEFLDKIMSVAAQKTSYMVCVANVHMFMEAQQNPSFLEIIKSANMVTPDGKPLCWALKLFYGIKQDRVAGMDLLPDLLLRMEKENLSAYFYGGSQQMLDDTQGYIKKTFPGLPIAGAFSPPFRPITPAEQQQQLDAINKATPHIVFVVLGCPKQEKWMASVKGKINAVTIGIGGALPVMIGLQKRAPGWMQHAGLEWLYRLAQEPRRLFKRYAVTNSLFIWHIVGEYFRLKLFKSSKK